MTMENKIRVVIIDDYDMTRSLLKIILRGEQFDIVGEATDGQSGLELCLKLKPDMVLLDVIMPVMNGIEALEKIHMHLPQALVMMVTGNDEHSVVNEAISKGASGYIVKPFNTASVIETMNQARDRFVLRSRANLQS